ncbi:hypothetical protein [Ruegeria hyattellae]|uniref:hypothetical protein n=1 Tax=Ruegeria hyattellae TaxID=3233337 RepID=UPI00355AE2F1
MSDTSTNLPEETSIDEDVAQAIISILETTNSPAIQRAREVIAHRLAISGDVAPSRIPPPRNITEVGGYLNLLTEYDEVEQRSRMIAAALGIAGPQINLPQPGALPPLSFVTRAQVRPVGPQQASFPLDFSLRSDFIEAFDTALVGIAARGGAMPVQSALRNLPLAGGMAPADGPAQIDLIGRLLRLAPTAALRDPAVDPLSITRPDAGGAFQVMARVIDPAATDAGTIPAEDWASWQCDAAQCSEVTSNDARFDLTPILNAAGWHQPSALSNPTTVTDAGNWSVWHNITGLVPGETRFGDELNLLYPAEAILTSPVFAQLDFVWTGSEFATP